KYCVAIPDDEHRYEIVDGVLYMAPSPNRGHQNAALEIASYLRTHIKLTGLGQVYIAPFDVELNPRTVVQPDVFVVLNPNLDKITESRIIGAPDLVVEVSSPGTVGYTIGRRSSAPMLAPVCQNIGLLTPGLARSRSSLW